MKKILLLLLLPLLSLFGFKANAITTLDLGADSILVCNSSFVNIVAPMTYSHYQWNTGPNDTLFFIKVSSKGWVKCTVSDLSGSSSDSVYVQFGSANILESDTTICSGASIQLHGYPRFDCGPFGAPVRHLVNGQSLGSNFTYVGSYNGHYYYKITSAGTWTDVSQLAQSTGGYLATINDSFEMNFIKSNSALNNTNLWIGLYRPSDNQSLRWSNCDNFTYTNWSSLASSPSTVAGKNYVFMHGSLCSDPYKWENISDLNLSNPDPCFQTIFGLVEFDDETNVKYFWSSGDTTSTITIQPNTSQNYTLFVQQFNKTCTDNINVNLWDLSNLISADTIKVCDADMAYIFAMSGLSSYTWNTGVTDSFIQVSSSSNPGWYYVHAVAPGNCSGDDSVYVSIANASIANADTTVCFGTSVLLKGPKAPMAYQSQYSQSFETSPYSGWNQQLNFNFNSSTVMGPYYNDSIVYFSSNLPSHDSVKVTFDLYIHDSWEGECSTIGKDKLKFYGGSKIAMDASFSNTNTCQQSYSNSGIPGVYAAETDAIKTNLVRRCNNSSKTTKYTVTRTFAHSSAKLDLSWVGSLNDISINQNICDESWSVDNVNIELRKASKITWSTGDSTQNITVTPSLGDNNYWVKIPVGNSFCYDSVKVTSYTGQIPMNLIAEDTVYACHSYSSIISLPNGYNSYMWSTGASSNQAKFYNPGWHYGAVELALGTCFGMDSIYFEKAGFTFEKNDTNICPGASIELIPFQETYCNPFGAPALTNYVAAQTISGYNYLGEYHGHHYYKANTSSDWSTAAYDALINGGHLVCINDLAEQNYIKQIASENVWLGLYKGNPTYYNWMNCDTVTYKNWATNEPNINSNGSAFMFGNNCVQNGQWKSFQDKDTSSTNACYNGIYGLLEIEVPNFFYSWSTGESSSTINIQPTKDTTINLKVRRYANSNIGECDAGSVNIHVVNNLNLNINLLKGDTIQCISNNSFQFVDLSINAGNSLIRHWDFGDGTISIDSIANKTYSQVGTYKVTLILENAGGCGTSKDFTVQVLANPTPVIASGNNPVCSFGTGNYFATTGSNITHSWFVTNGSVNNVSGTNNEQLTVDWPTTNNGIIILRDSNIISGCVANSAPLIINVLPQPIIGFTVNDSTQCYNGHQFIFTDTSKQVTPIIQRIWTYSDLFQSTDSIAVKTFSGSGNHTVQLAVMNANGCVNTLFKNLYLLSNNTPLISGPKTTCDNSFGSYYLNGDTSTSKYTWLVSGGNIISGQGTDSIRVTWGSLGKGTILVRDSSKVSGCAANSNLDTVYINPYTAPVINGTNPVCKNVAGYYSATFDNNKVYTWTVTGGAIFAGQGTSSIGVLWNNSGTGSIIVKDSLVTTGCKGTSNSFSVNIIASPDVPNMSGQQMVCENGINAYQVPFVSGHYYKWSVVGGTIINGQGTSVLDVKWDAIHVDSAGPLNGSLLVLDSIISSGCKQSGTPYIIQINKTPNPVITGKLNACGFEQVNYNTPFNNIRVYRWEISNGTIISGQGTSSLNVVWDNTKTSGTLRVLDSLVSGACKTFSPTINITINQVTKPIINGTNNVCENTYTTYTISNKAGHKFTWLISGGSIFSNKGDTQLTIFWNGGLSSGSIQVKDSITSSNCTINSDVLNISINKITAPIVSGNDSLCEGSNEVYTILPEFNHTYIWTVANGTIQSGQGTANLTVNWNLPGTGTISIQDSINTNGCTISSTPMSIWVATKPKPVITGPSSICSNSNTFYTTTFVANHTYNWTVSGGNIVSGQNSSLLTMNWTGTGIGNLSLEEIDTISGCSTSTAGFPVLKSQNPAPGVSGPPSICVNTEAIYTTLTNADRVYIWTITGGTILTGQGTNEINVLWDVKGKGSVSLKDSSISSGCVSPITSIEVSVVNAPLALIGGATLKCVGDTAQYGSIPGTGRTYDWSVIGGTIISGTGTERITVIWQQGGKGLVNLTETVSSTSCSNSSTRKVTVVAKPNAYFSTRIIGGTVDLTPLDSGLNYKWYFGDGDSSVLRTPAHSYGSNGTYTIILNISTNEGCKNDSSLSLSINKVGIEDFSGMRNSLTAYPNPFNGRTRIAFKLSESSDVDLEVYDMMGSLVSKLIDNEKLNAGEYEQEFNLTNQHSVHGAYLVRLRMGNQFKTIRIVAE